MLYYNLLTNFPNNIMCQVYNKLLTNFSNNNRVGTADVTN